MVRHQDRRTINGDRHGVISKQERNLRLTKWWTKTAARGPRSLGAIRQPEQRATGLSIDTVPTVTTATGTWSCRVGSVRSGGALDAATTVRCGES